MGYLAFVILVIAVTYNWEKLYTVVMGESPKSKKNDGCVHFQYKQFSGSLDVGHSADISMEEIATAIRELAARK